MQLTTCHRHFEYRLRLNLLRGASVKCNCASCHSSENRWEELGMILFLSAAALHPVMWRVMCAMSRGRAWRVTEWRSVSRRRHLDTGTCPHPAAPAGTYLTYLTYIIVFICLSMHPIHSVSSYIFKRKQFLSLTQMDSFRVDWLNIFCLVSEKENAYDTPVCCDERGSELIVSALSRLTAAAAGTAAAGTAAPWPTWPSPAPASSSPGTAGSPGRGQPPSTGWPPPSSSGTSRSSRRTRRKKMAEILVKKCQLFLTSIRLMFSFL